MTEYVELGNLKGWRKFHGLSQEDLAEVAQIDRRTLQRYENGERRAPLERASRIARCLGLDAEDIAGPAAKADPCAIRPPSRTSGSVEEHVLEPRLENLERIESRLLSVLESLETAVNAAAEKPEKRTPLRTLLGRIFS